MDIENNLFTKTELVMLITGLVWLKEDTTLDTRWNDRYEDIYCSLLNRLTYLLDEYEDLEELQIAITAEY